MKKIMEILNLNLPEQRLESRYSQRSVNIESQMRSFEHDYGAMANPVSAKNNTFIQWDVIREKHESICLQKSKLVSEMKNATPSALNKKLLTQIHFSMAMHLHLFCGIYYKLYSERLKNKAYDEAGQMLKDILTYSEMRLEAINTALYTVDQKNLEVCTAQQVVYQEYHQYLIDEASRWTSANTDITNDPVNAMYSEIVSENENTEQECFDEVSFETEHASFATVFAQIADANAKIANVAVLLQSITEQESNKSVSAIDSQSPVSNFESPFQDQFGDDEMMTETDNSFEPNESSVILSNLYKNSTEFVGASRATPTSLTGDLKQAREENRAIHRNTLLKRQLVDADTGQTTMLQGDTLEQAKKNGAVITLSQFYNRRLVDASTGRPTKLQGEALEHAKEKQNVVAYSAFISRQLVDTATGLLTTLNGNELEQAKKSGAVQSRTAYNSSRHYNRLTKRKHNESISDNSVETSLQPFMSARKKVKETSPTPGFMVVPVPGDGHCFYHAVSLYVGKDYQSLRNLVADYVQNNPNEFEHIVNALDQQTMDDFITGIRASEYADNIEIEALERAFPCNIVIHTDNGIVNRDRPVNTEAFEIHVYYNGHNHYDGLLKKSSYASFVDASTGTPTTLTGDLLKQAREEERVIHRTVFVKRKLVDAKTGELTLLEGDDLEQAKMAETVISRSKFYSRQLVDTMTGKHTTLQGEALEQAKKTGAVMSYGNFKSIKFSTKRKHNESVTEPLRPSSPVFFQPVISDERRAVDAMLGLLNH